jgi:hypothetical protein
MNVIHSNLFYVVNRFPDRKNTILQFYRKNQNFQVICDDYRRCIQALKQWNEFSNDKALARREEYADLLIELELEIMQYLDEPMGGCDDSAMTRV